MPKRNRAVQAPEGAAAIGEARAIVRRLIEDDELRAHVGRAIELSRRVYERVGQAKQASKLLDDKRLHADVSEAHDAVRSIAASLAGVADELPTSPRAARKKRHRLRRLVLLTGVGGGAALVLSEGLRSKLLDLLFGAEEEFEYTQPPVVAPTDSPGSPLSAV